MAADSKDINIELASGAGGDVLFESPPAELTATTATTATATAAAATTAAAAATATTAAPASAEPQVAEESDPAAAGRVESGAGRPEAGGSPETLKEMEMEAGTQQHSLPYAPLPVPTISEQVSGGDSPGGGSGKKKERVPRRILHFSDGTLEEYSTDEDAEDQVDATEQQLQQLRLQDTRGMSWLQWGWHWLCLAGYSTLSRVDATGERLAWFLGITSPKYQYELDEYYEMQRREKEEKEQQDLEAAGWTPGSQKTTNPGAAYQVSDQSETAAQAANQSASAAAVTSEPVSGQPISAEHSA